MPAKLAQKGGLSLKIDRQSKTGTAPVLIHYETFVVSDVRGFAHICRGGSHGLHHSTSFGQRLSRFSAVLMPASPSHDSATKIPQCSQSPPKKGEGWDQSEIVGLVLFTAMGGLHLHGAQFPRVLETCVIANRPFLTDSGMVKAED